MAIDAGVDGDDVVMASDILDEQLEVWQARHDRHCRGEALIGLSTGLNDLDEKIGGLQPEQLIIVAGRPAMGKTTLAMGFVIDAAIRQAKSALVVSLEMSKGQLIDRAMASEGRIPLSLIKNGTACQSHGTEMGVAARKIKQSGLCIADRAGATVGRIRSLARRHKMRYGLDLLMVDYLQLMERAATAPRKSAASAVVASFWLVSLASQSCCSVSYPASVKSARTSALCLPTFASQVPLSRMPT